MARQTIINEVLAEPSHVWDLLTDPREVVLWAPNVRDLEMEPKDSFAVDSIRRFRLDVGGKIETVDTRITHCIDGEMFAEQPIGGSMKLHEKVQQMKIVFRIEAVEQRSCSLILSLDYEMKGFFGKMFEKLAIGGFTSQYRLWMERLKTYAETGRPV